MVAKAMHVKQGDLSGARLAFMLERAEEPAGQESEGS